MGKESVEDPSVPAGKRANDEARKEKDGQSDGNCSSKIILTGAHDHM